MTKKQASLIAMCVYNTLGEDFGKAMLTGLELDNLHDVYAKEFTGLTVTEIKGMPEEETSVLDDKFLPEVEAELVKILKDAMAVVNS